jgi:hypothetical protein
MDTKAATSAGLTTLATSGLKAFAGALVVHGYMSSGNTEAFVGVGMLALTGVYSFWKDYGRAMAIDSLDILRAKVSNAAAAARANQVSPTSALAKLDQHVTDTTPPAKLLP